MENKNPFRVYKQQTNNKQKTEKSEPPFLQDDSPHFQVYDSIEKHP